MKEELINKFFEQLLEFVKMAGNEVPKYADELLRYGEVVSYVGVVLFSIVAVLCVAWFFFALIKFENDDYAGASVILSTIFFIIAVMCLSCNGFNLIKIKTAPRVYIIEQLSR